MTALVLIYRIFSLLKNGSAFLVQKRSSFYGPVAFNIWPLFHEGVSEVCGEVDAEADGDDDVGRGHDVDGQTPEVHEAADINLEREPFFWAIQYYSQTWANNHLSITTTILRSPLELSLHL